MATKLTMVPIWKQDIFNKIRNIEIGAFDLQLSWNKDNRNIFKKILKEKTMEKHLKKSRSIC